jgi:hypothetical protein
MYSYANIFAQNVFRAIQFFGDSMKVPSEGIQGCVHQVKRHIVTTIAGICEVLLSVDPLNYGCNHISRNRADEREQVGPGDVEQVGG